MSVHLHLSLSPFLSTRFLKMDTKFLSQNSFSVENIVEIKSEQLIVIEPISFLKIYQENMQDKTGICNLVETRVVSENKKTLGNGKDPKNFY